MTQEIYLILSFLITGIILLTFYIFINKLEILWTSYVFIAVGLIVSTLLNFSKTNLLLSNLLIIFIIVFNIYITVTYKNEINDGRVSSSYYSLTTSNIILFYLEMYVLFKYFMSMNNNNSKINNQGQFDIFQLAIIGFLITLQIIISSTNMIVLKDFSTDG